MMNHGNGGMNNKETMAKKGVEFAHECLIFEVCQPQQAKRVLDQNMSVSTALPCRISVYEEGEKTILATLKPTTLLAMFNAPQLAGAAQEVEDTTVKIMKDALSARSAGPLTFHCHSFKPSSQSGGPNRRCEDTETVM